MTNEQLAVLLSGLKLELMTVIGKVEAKLPDDARRIQIRRIKGDLTISFNPNDYEWIDTNEYEILQPLKDYVQILEGRIAILRPEQKV